MRKFLNFDEMVTPGFISVIYWIGLGLIALGFLGSLSSSYYLGFWFFLLSLIGSALAAILWRVACEMMLVVFRIHNVLATIAVNTGSLPPAPAPGVAP